MPDPIKRIKFGTRRAERSDKRNVRSYNGRDSSETTRKGREEQQQQQQQQQPCAAPHSPLSATSRREIDLGLPVGFMLDPPCEACRCQKTHFPPFAVFSWLANCNKLPFRPTAGARAIVSDKGLRIPERLALQNASTAVKPDQRCERRRQKEAVLKSSSKENCAKWGNAEPASPVLCETTTRGNHEDERQLSRRRWRRRRGRR
ncbi:hypothetical protein AOLI_G00077670 [Acnodon oligacanthus]